MVLDSNPTRTVGEACTPCLTLLLPWGQEAKYIFVKNVDLTDQLLRYVFFLVASPFVSQSVFLESDFSHLIYFQEVSCFVLFCFVLFCSQMKSITV